MYLHFQNETEKDQGSFASIGADKDQTEKRRIRAMMERTRRRRYPMKGYVVFQHDYYKLSYGYKDESEGRYIYNLNGLVTVNGEQRITDAEWYSRHRPFVHAMYFPDLFGERVCQVYMDFVLYEDDNMDAVDNGGALRINFPVTISGMGTDTLTITDNQDDFSFVFTIMK